MDSRLVTVRQPSQAVCHGGGRRTGPIGGGQNDHNRRSRHGRLSRLDVRCRQVRRVRLDRYTPVCGKETLWRGIGFTITLSDTPANMVCLALGRGTVALSLRERIAFPLAEREGYDRKGDQDVTYGLRQWAVEKEFMR